MRAQPQYRHRRYRYACWWKTSLPWNWYAAIHVQFILPDSYLQLREGAGHHNRLRVTECCFTGYEAIPLLAWNIGRHMHWKAVAILTYQIVYYCPAGYFEKTTSICYADPRRSLKLLRTLFFYKFGAYSKSWASWWRNCDLTKTKQRKYLASGVIFTKTGLNRAAQNIICVPMHHSYLTACQLSFVIT